MKRVLLLCIILCMTLVQGCTGKWVSANVTPIDIYKVPDKLEIIKNYKLNQKQFAYIGQEIIKVKPFIEKATEIPQVEISETIYADIAGKRKLEVKAQVHPLKDKILYDVINGIGNSGQTYYLLPVTNNHDDWRWGLLLSEDGIISDKAIYCYNNSMLWLPPILIVKPNIKRSIRSSIKEKIPGPGVSFELIYSGRNDVSLNIMYREYTSDNLARPSFFQNFTYEANAKQIRFKDFILQIHEATNEKLDYTVVKDDLMYNK